MSRQTLEQAILLVRSGRGLRDVARCGLSGCPVGGWGQTEQAKRAMAEALPHRSERTYSVNDLIAALYYEDSAGRYQRKPVGDRS